MEKKKSTYSWTISDELWEEIKEYTPKKQRDLSKHYQKAPDKSGPPGKFWKVSSMFCGSGANGKRSHGNMGAAAVFTDIFKNGKKQASLKR